MENTEDRKNTVKIERIEGDGVAYTLSVEPVPFNDANLVYSPHDLEDVLYASYKEREFRFTLEGGGYSSHLVATLNNESEWSWGGGDEGIGGYDVRLPDGHVLEFDEVEPPRLEYEGFKSASSMIVNDLHGRIKRARKFYSQVELALGDDTLARRPSMGADDEDDLPW